MRAVFGRALIVMALLALAAVPGSAVAKRHGRHGGHHKRHHARHSRLRVFGRDAVPGTPASDSAGTVDSFTGGVLTIKLASGGTVSGKVTAGTEIECETIAPKPEKDDFSLRSDGERGDGERGDDGPPSPTAKPTPSPRRGERGDGEKGDKGEIGDKDDGDETEADEDSCGPSALTPGAIVREAELKIGPGGAIFESVELVK